MKPLLFYLFAVLTAFPVVAAPNIVLIIGDDQSWNDYGFMGHDVVATPQLDGLASRSLVFERGYVTAPLCRPSLASILTGLYPFQHGITGNDVNGSKDRARLDIPLRQSFHQHPSLVKALVASGYLAHQSGKWWEGSWKDGGFTHGMTHGDPKRGGRHGDDGLTIGRKGMKPLFDFIDLAVDQQKPFFAWYAHSCPTLRTLRHSAFTRNTNDPDWLKTSRNTMPCVSGSMKPVASCSITWTAGRSPRIP